MRSPQAFCNMIQKNFQFLSLLQESCNDSTIPIIFHQFKFLLTPTTNKGTYFMVSLNRNKKLGYLIWEQYICEKANKAATLDWHILSTSIKCLYSTLFSITPSHSNCFFHFPYKSQFPIEQQLQRVKRNSYERLQHKRLRLRLKENTAFGPKITISFFFFFLQTYGLSRFYNPAASNPSTLIAVISPLLMQR